LENYFTVEECERYFKVLTNDIDWRHQQITVTSQESGDRVTGDEPRRTLFMSDPGICYEYSGRENVGQQWHPAVLEIKKKAEEGLAECGLPQVVFNSAQMNRYDFPRHTLGMHADNEPDLDRDSPIVSVSFGATRDFVIQAVHMSIVVYQCREPLMVFQGLVNPKVISLADGSWFVMGLSLIAARCSNATYMACPYPQTQPQPAELRRQHNLSLEGPQQRIEAKDLIRTARFDRIIRSPTVTRAEATRHCQLKHSIKAMQETALAKLLRSESLAAVLRWHEQGQKRLSIGLELECFLPDLGALVPDRLVPLREPQELFRLVARVLSERVAELGAEKCRSGGPGLVSAEACDWGRLWTTTADGSIQPQGQNPFPVELVSKRMGFQEFDVTLFCDMAHALRRPPLCAATNESTGVHVHLGCHPSFFSVEEVAAIMKVYLRFEPTINELLLPVTRQRNRFCRDLREVLGRAQGLGPGASDDALFAKIDAAVAFVRTLSPEARAACLEGSQVRLKKDELLLALLEEGGLFRLKRPLQALQVSQHAQSEQGLLLPAGLALVELSLASGQLLWRPPTCQDLQALWGKEGDAQTPSNGGDGLA
ncbi:Alkbh2, partial [Symbiodinium necroappetens]